MSRSADIHFPLYSLLLGVGSAAAVTAAAVSLSLSAPLEPDLLLFGLLAVPSCALAYSLRPATTLSLDIAYLLAACILFPLPAPVVVAFLSGCASSALSSRQQRHRADILIQAAVNAGTLIALSAAGRAAVQAAWGPSVSLGRLASLAVTAAGFAGLTAAHVTMILLSALMRGERPLLEVRRYLARILPYDLLAIPISLLVVLNLRAGSSIGFLLLAGLSLLGGLLVRRLDRTRLDLSYANRNLQKRIEELQSLNQIGRQLASTLSPRQILEAVARECGKIFPQDYCVAALFDPETRDLQVQIARDGQGALVASPELSSLAFAQWALSGFRPLLAGELRKDALPEPLRAALHSPSVRSVMAAPLRVEGKATGMICMQSRRGGAYDMHMLSLLSTVAQQAAIAIESARNYQRAIRDELTGLYQKDYFFQRLQDELMRSGRYGSPFAVLMLDLDGFKRINDLHGHIGGDRYLRALGQVIVASLRAADIPCRFGGEEFCLLLPETDLPGARAIAERIREAVAVLQVMHEGETVRTTISIGVAVHPQHFAGTSASLVQQADEALYAAKRAGKNRVMAAAA